MDRFVLNEGQRERGEGREKEEGIAFALFDLKVYSEH